MYGQDGSYVLMNNEVGFSGYDRLGKSDLLGITR